MLIYYLVGGIALDKIYAALLALFFAGAGVFAVWLHRLGIRKATGTPIFPRRPVEWGILVWDLVFFLLTGALRIRPAKNLKNPGKAWFAGVRFSLYGLAGSCVLYVITQITDYFVGSSVFSFISLSLVAANLSAVLTGLLPFPGFDAGTFLASKLSPARREGFEKAEILTFFAFTALALFFARIGWTFTAITFPCALLS